MKAKDLQERRAILVAEMRSITEKPAGTGGDLSPEQAARFDALKAELQTVEGRRVWAGRVRLAGRARDGRTASVNIPTRLLEEDDYLLTVTGAAAGEAEGRVESFHYTALRR